MRSVSDKAVLGHEAVRYFVVYCQYYAGGRFILLHESDEWAYTVLMFYFYFTRYTEIPGLNHDSYLHSLPL